MAGDSVEGQQRRRGRSIDRRRCRARQGQDFAGEAMDASADAAGDRNRAEQMQRLVGWVIDGLKDATESHQHALETVRQTMAIVDQTQLAPLLASGR